MQSARVLGKIAQQSNINAPTLDVDMSSLLEGSEIFKRVQLLAQWWEGWYDGLHEQACIYDESIASVHQSKLGVKDVSFIQ